MTTPNASVDPASWDARCYVRHSRGTASTPRIPLHLSSHILCISGIMQHTQRSVACGRNSCPLSFSRQTDPICLFVRCRKQTRQPSVDASPVLPKAVKHVQRRFRKHRDDDDPPASDAARHAPRLVPSTRVCRRPHRLISEQHPGGYELQLLRESQHRSSNGTSARWSSDLCALKDVREPSATYVGG